MTVKSPAFCLLFNSCKIFDSPVTCAVGAAFAPGFACKHQEHAGWLRCASSDIGPVENWPAMKPASMFASQAHGKFGLQRQGKAGQAVGKSKTAEFGSRMPPSLKMPKILMDSAFATPEASTLAEACFGTPRQIKSPCRTSAADRGIGNSQSQRLRL